MSLEPEARKFIDLLFEAAGWVIEAKKDQIGDSSQGFFSQGKLFYRPCSRFKP